MARAMCKWSVVVHAVVLAVGLLDAESARGSGHRRFFKRPKEQKKTEATDQRSDRSEQREVDVSFLPGWASKVLIASILGAGLSPTRIV